MLCVNVWVYRVTRLIKASKNTKSTRDSFINLPTSLSQSSLSSSSSPHSHSHSQYHNPLSHNYNPLPSSTSSSNTKLTAAQAELQACETQLAAKERELDAMRISVVRDGLRARCLALVECGWSWGEMGKEGMRALEEMGGLGGAGNGYGESLISFLGPSVSVLFVGSCDFDSCVMSWTTKSFTLVGSTRRTYYLHRPSSSRSSPVVLAARDLPPLPPVLPHHPPIAPLRLPPSPFSLCSYLGLNTL